MTTENTSLSSAPALVVTRDFDATPERIFAALTDARELAQWFGPENVTTEIVSFEPRAGAPYHFIMRHADGDEHPVAGVIEDIAPPHKLVMSWVWEKGNYAGRETRLCIDLAPVESGTRLTLTHELLADDEARDLHEHGWNSALNSLATHLTRG